MKLYRQVSTTERLPDIRFRFIGIWNSGEVSNVILTGQGYFYSVEMECECDQPDYWLEELPELPTEEEIKNKIRKFYGIDELAIFLEGANYIINLIKNK